MKKHRILISAFAILIGSSANADHHGKKFVSIFDGKTLEGWTQRNGTATYEVKEGRHGYLVLADGSIELNGIVMNGRDGAAITGPESVTLKGVADAEIVFVDTV